jgi:hypothetical protein
MFGVLMEKEEKVKEQVKFHTEVLRLGVIALLTIGDGTMSLTNESEFTGRRNFFMSSGLFACIVLIVYLFKKFKTINRLIK